MGEIVSLRRKRKTVARAEAEAKAVENRIRFGRTKAERRAAEREEDLQMRRLEGHALAKRERT